jgi:hypothetical protein
MATFDLSHLTQPANEAVMGPIQDSEALLLYALIRVMRLRTILELGMGHGYSATNFLKAVGPKGIVYSCDYAETHPLASNHRTIAKDAKDLTSADVDDKRLDLMFFDCHDYKASLAAFGTLLFCGNITNHTILAIHDTNLHPVKFNAASYRIEGGFVHQPTERKLVKHFKDLGYDAVCFHTEMDRHDDELPYRHGLTIMQKHKRLEVE